MCRTEDLIRQLPVEHVMRTEAPVFSVGVRTLMVVCVAVCALPSEAAAC